MRFAAILWALAAGVAGAQDAPPAWTRWTPLQEKPVFVGAPGQWDALIRERGWILVENGQWKLWYTGYDSPTGMRRLGLATSTDGLAWTRHPANPLVPDRWVEDVTVVKNGDEYLMFAEGKDDQAQMLRSRDGVRWTSAGTLDVRTVDGRPIPPGPFGTPTVHKHNDLWHLLYERNDKGVWLATSKDLKVWTHASDAPVLTPGPGLYDRDLIALNQIVTRGGKHYAFYHGCANAERKEDRLWCVGLAVSDDLRTWTRFAGNPLLPRTLNRSSGILIETPAGPRLYTMHGAVHVHVPAK